MEEHVGLTVGVQQPMGSSTYSIGPHMEIHHGTQTHEDQTSFNPACIDICMPNNFKRTAVLE
eukprot:12917788-Prorocentrum_lima.AAC.1